MRLPLPARLLLSTALCSLAACGDPDSTATVGDGADTSGAATWTSFLASTFQEKDTGIYIVDGDTPVEDVKQLREFYEHHVLPGQLIVHQRNGVDQKWTDPQKLNLTYCVSSAFGARKAAVVQAMAEATQAWQAAANVKYVYSSAQDGACNNANANVLFDVSPTSAGGQFLARAFFPGNARSARSVLIDGTAFGPNAGVSLTGILRHELGHTLGFRHEHTRPEAGACFEDNSWRPLTAYDSASVMHYPQCNGSANTLALTALDKAGAQSLYGAPGSAPPAPPPPSEATTVTERFGGNVALNQNVFHGPFAVVAGTSFEVVMTGAGDPDLYVRFGALPTPSAFDCRPYRTGASETCRLTVPAGQSAAQVMVRGYTAATYALAVTYVKANAPAGDTAPPTFAGLATATATGASSVRLTWTAASDAVTAASGLVYDVYRSTSATVSFTSPAFSTVPGATSADVTGLTASTPFFFAVRARDAAGNRETNTVVRSATTRAASTGDAALEDQVLTAINAHRAAGASCGGTAFPPVAALTMNAALRTAARGHSLDMATKDYFSHVSQDGRTFDQRIRAAGYAGSPLGENIAAGYATAPQVVAAWMGSTGHCRNIMNGAFRSIGVGLGVDQSSTYGRYWTQDFGGQ